MNDNKTDAVVPRIIRHTLVAYHANCIDGFTSAWVTQQACVKRGDVVTLLPMNYDSASINTLMPLLKDGYYSLYIVDYSVMPSVLEEIAKGYPDTQTTMLDHHKTAFESYYPSLELTKDSYEDTMLYPNVRVVLDNNQSGASLCWKFFNPGEPVPILVSYVKDYDLWRFEEGNRTRWVNKFLGQARKDLDNWSDIAYQLDNDPRDIEAKGKQMQQAQDYEIQEIAALCTSIHILGFIGLATLCLDKKYVSDVGHILATQSNTFGACYSIDTSRNVISWSLRSNGDFDVSAIAKAFGGGGHKNAAGFETVLVPPMKIAEVAEVAGIKYD